MKLPAPFIRRIKNKLGIEADELLAAMDEPPPVSIRLHPAKGKGLFEEDEVIPWCNYGRFLSERPAYVFDPLYHAGCYYSQEASSMFFPNMIDFSKPIKVLDLCAAPGGKSSLLLSFLKEGSLLVSNEMVGTRNVILYENLVKWGSYNTIITQNRPKDFLPMKGYFDVVLVDAPCSGEGMFRKDADVAATWTERMVEGCSIMQKEILQTATTLVKDGGTLIYSTCTYEEAENENILDWLNTNLKSRTENISFSQDKSWGLTEVNTGNLKGYYCYPHKVKGEGQFFSGIKIFGNGKGSNASYKKMQTLSAKEIRFLTQYINSSTNLEFYRKENLVCGISYSLANDFQLINSFLKVKKWGLECGELIRDTFIPAHEVAATQTHSEIINRVELTLEEAINYQQRKAPSPIENLEKGWFLYTYKNMNLGWAKNLGTRINNHYPAHWKIRKEYI